MSLRPVSILVSAAITIAALFSSALAAPEFWSEFRGPTGQGHSAAAGVPEKWSADKNVAWKRSIAGHGWSTPILIGSRLFLTTAVPKDPGAGSTDRSLRALSLDAQSGETIWDIEVFLQGAANAAKIHQKNTHASPTPLYEDGKLYVHFGHDGTACLDARDGRVLWKQTSLRYPPVHGNGGCPIVAGEHLIFSCDGAADPVVVALNKNNGSVVWKTKRDVTVERPFSFSTPLLIDVGGTPQVVSAGSGAVIAYEPGTGRELWRCEYDEGYSVVPRPSYANGLVYVCTGFNTASLLAVRPDGRGDVNGTHLAWEHNKAVPKNSSPIVVGDLLFMVDDKGIATCLDALSGEVHWQERLGGNFSASPIHADGKLYFPSEEGIIHVIEPSKTFRSLAQNEMSERTFATVVPTDGAIFVRGETHLWRIEDRG